MIGSQADNKTRSEIGRPPSTRLRIFHLAIPPGASNPDFSVAPRSCSRSRTVYERPNLERMGIAPTEG
jgi:hypothetical protein